MKYVISHLLEDLHDQSEINISKAIKEWQQLPAIRLLSQPAPGKWSAVQCLDHLNSYGRYYLPAIEKAVSKVGTVKSVFFNSGWLGNYFYKSMLVDNSGAPVTKMNSPKNHRPHENLQPGKVLNEFICQQEKLLILLSKAKSVDISKARVPISIAPFIKIKLGDTFLFFIAHINRHLLQAQRAIDNSCLDLSKVEYADIKTA